jgi:4-hydroxyphenylacetate decarboxylase large subunit
MSREDEFYQEALKRGSTSVDEHSKFGTGGGNVTHSFGKVVSIAGKFGIRTEEIPILLHLARLWHQKSVDDMGHKYEQMVPSYDINEKIMRNIVCMFDSGYTLPQGREVINYFYPLEYGFDRLLETAQEKKASVAGRPDGDGLTGMNRLSISEQGPKKPSPGTGNRAGYSALRAFQGFLRSWILSWRAPRAKE